MLPAKREWHRIAERGRCPLEIGDACKALAKEDESWIACFVPGLRDQEPGTHLTNLEYAPLAEIMGRVAWAPEVFNPIDGSDEVHLRVVMRNELRRSKANAGTMAACYTVPGAWVEADARRV